MFDINDPATWSEIGHLDPELAEIARDFKPCYTREGTDYLQTRKEWTAQARQEANDALLSSSEQVTEHEIFIPVQDGAMRALVYSPKQVPPLGSSLVVLFHGGAFCFGPPEFESLNCVNVAQKYGCVALSLDYPLAPEVKWPHVFYRAWEALEWIASNYLALKADPAQGFIIGGCSAGGLIAAVCAHWAQDRQLKPALTGVHYSVAGFGSPEHMPLQFRPFHTSRENAKIVIRDPPPPPPSSPSFNPLAALELDTDSPLWNVVAWPSGHAGQPRSFFQVCGLDTTRDDSLIMERLLRDAGVETRVVLYPGLPHIFWLTYPRHSQRSKYLSDTLDGFGWLLDIRSDI